jgi:hypothetical protein
MIWDIRYFTAFLGISKLRYVSPEIIYHYISTLTVSSSNRHPVYQDMFLLDILTLENGTNWISQNVGMELPLYAAYNPRRQQVSKHVQFNCV